MAFKRPTLGELIRTAEAEINALVKNADARLRFSMLNVFARVWAALTDGLYSALVFLSRQLFAMTATRVFLERIAESYGIYRLAATAAQGVATCTGAPGSVVPSGSLFLRADGVLYQSTAGAIIRASGTVDVPVIALVTGALGNAVAGVLLQPASPIAGVSGVVVSIEEIGGGADEEKDGPLRVRLLMRLRNPPGAGTIKDWERWAYSMSAAITRVWVVPTVYGNGTVGLVFAQDGAGIVPPPSVLAQMRAHLAQFTPAGSTLYVFAPTLKKVNFTMREIPTADPAVQTNIANELDDLLYREAGPGQTIPITHVHEAISTAQGEYDHTLTTPTEALVFKALAPIFEVGVLGDLHWN